MPIQPAPQRLLSIPETALFKLLVRLEDGTVSEVMDALPAEVPSDKEQVRSLLDGLVAKGVIGHKGGAHDLYYIFPSALKRLTSLFAEGSQGTLIDAVDAGQGLDGLSIDLILTLLGD